MMQKFFLIVCLCAVYGLRFGLDVASSSLVKRRAMQEVGIPSTIEEEGEKNDLVERLIASARSGEDVDELVKNEFDKISQEVVTDLTRLQSEGETFAQSALTAVREESEKRMLRARDLLVTVLDAGELLEMDRRLTKLFRDGVIDTSFLVVLNMNAVAAAEASQKNPNDEAALQRSRVMEHLYTRAQEEWETRFVPMAEGVLHRLARTEQPVIRRNILEHYLAPKTHIDVPTKDPVPLDKPQPPLLPSAEFAQAIHLAVTRLRTLQNLDPAIIEASIESLRAIAKEARLVLIDSVTPEEVQQFQNDLAKTWQINAPPPEQDEV
mmetsp:Transcript_9329/g.12923  ORF Transcript_9329/g.12923 Transcript_9329/m.12923 type:complete len:323 (-) Transcript_9329:1197-2165(-)